MIEGDKSLQAINQNKTCNEIPQEKKKKIGFADDKDRSQHQMENSYQIAEGKGKRKKDKGYSSKKASITLDDVKKEMIKDLRHHNQNDEDEYVDADIIVRVKAAPI